MKNASGIGWWFQPVPQIWWSFRIIPIIWIPNSKSAWIRRRISGCRWLPYICLYIPAKKYGYRFVSDSILCDAKSLSRTLHQSNSSGDMAANKPMLRLKQQTSLPLRSHGIVSDVPATVYWYFFMFSLWSAKRSPPVKKRLRARSQFLEHAVKHWHLPLTGFSTTHVATWPKINQNNSRFCDISWWYNDDVIILMWW